MAAAASDGPVEAHSWRGLVAVAAAVAVMATAPWWAGRGGSGSPARPTVLDAAVDRSTTTMATDRSGRGDATTASSPSTTSPRTTSTAGRSVPVATVLGGADQAEVTDGADGAAAPASGDPSVAGATATSDSDATPGDGPRSSPATTPATATTAGEAGGEPVTTAAPPAPTTPPTTAAAPDTTVPPATTPPTAPPTTRAPEVTTTTSTAAPLPIVTFGVLCSPAGARGVTVAGTPAICSLTNGEGRPNRDGRARWRHAS